MTRDDIIRMARESGFEVDEEGEILESDKWHTQTIFVERFAALVAAAEREKVAHWMMTAGYATGHGDTTEDLLYELTWQSDERIARAITAEREECAKVCDFNCSDYTREGAEVCAVEIRAGSDK